MNVSPLIILKARRAVHSGGYYRLYELLKIGKEEKINYIVVTDHTSYRNFVYMFPDFIDILRQYKTYCISSGEKNHTQMPGLKVIMDYKDCFSYAISISKIAKNEKTDLIIGPSEGTQIVWTSYFSGNLSRKPWTALFQGEKDIFQPTNGLSPINPFNVLKHINGKRSMKNASLMSKLGFSIELQGLLKICEKSLILTVGRTLSDAITYLNPRISFHIISPGNGVDLKRFNKRVRDTTTSFDCLYFSRLVPEKGLFELPFIWKKVVKKFPQAKLAVAGPVENQTYVNIFKKMISEHYLSRNVVYLGFQDKDSIIELISRSKITIYPSFLDVFSLVVLESLAGGTPVVAYNIPAIKYNFSDCKAVLPCTTGDRTMMAKKIIFLLENEDLRDKLSKNAKEYAKKFDWKNVVKAEKEAYFKVIEWFSSS
jgi:glycosyltransferase involved in cell wall biosynthesis